VRSAVRSLIVVAALAHAGCGKKSKTAAPALAGLAAVPASAEAVLVADVARVSDSPLVGRAVDTLLGRDADLATRWQKLHETCKIDIGNIKHVILAIGPHAGPQPGTGPVLLVATGKLSETELATCVRDVVGQGSGSLTTKQADGRTIYEAKDGNRVMYFAFSSPDTVVMGSSEPFVLEGVSATGKKALDNPELKRWIDLADQKAPLWAAGKVDDRVKIGLVRVTAGAISAGPTALTLSADLGPTVKLDLSLVMANANDAKGLQSFMKTQQGLLGYAAQAKGMGKLVDAVVITAENDVLKLHVQLGPDDVNRILNVLDGGGGGAQGSPPPQQ
jgi:hypothetical protein